MRVHPKNVVKTFTPKGLTSLRSSSRVRRETTPTQHDKARARKDASLFLLIPGRIRPTINQNDSKQLKLPHNCKHQAMRLCDVLDKATEQLMWLMLPSLTAWHLGHRTLGRGSRRFALVIMSRAAFEGLLYARKGFVQPVAAFAGRSLGELSALLSFADILSNSSIFSFAVV
jgi:hypothetical protein